MVIDIAIAVGIGKSLKNRFSGAADFKRINLETLRNRKSSHALFEEPFLPGPGLGGLWRMRPCA